MARELKFISWDEYMILVDSLVEKLRQRFPIGVRLVGIPRGGRILADILSHRWSEFFVRKQEWNPFQVSPECYEEFDGTKLPPDLPLCIVDDVLETGEALTEYFKFYNVGRNTKIEAAVLISKPDARPPDGLKVAVAESMSSKDWVVFPYETTEGEAKAVEEHFK